MGLYGSRPVQLCSCGAVGLWGCGAVGLGCPQRFSLHMVWHGVFFVAWVWFFLGIEVAVALAILDACRHLSGAAGLWGCGGIVGWGCGAVGGWWGGAVGLWGDGGVGLWGCRAVGYGCIGLLGPWDREVMALWKWDCRAPGL